MNKNLTIIIAIAFLLGGFLIYHYVSNPGETMEVTQVGSESSVATGEEITRSADASEENPTTYPNDPVTEDESSIASEIKSEPVAVPTQVADSPKEPLIKTMLVAGGCFWCVEADAEKLSGVVEAVSGYAEGSTENPTYKNYSKTGHREVVEVTYDANKVTFSEVIINAIKHMDPTDDNGSFGDRGDHYSPALYYENDAELKIINDLITKIDQNGPYDKPLAIEVIPRPKFWIAEDYHQDYYKGTLSALKYKYYRNGSGRDAFIKKNWGADTGPTLNF